MTLKLLANGYADVDQRLDLLRQRQKDIGVKPKVSDYFTAFVMDKIRQGENKKSGGNGDER